MSLKPIYSIGFLIPFCMTSCREGYVPVLPPDIPVQSYCECIFLRGLPSNLEVGQSATFFVEWEGGVLEEVFDAPEAVIELLKGSSIASLSHDRDSYTISTLTEGKVILRVTVGGKHKDFIIFVNATHDEDPKRAYIHSNDIMLVSEIGPAMKILTGKDYPVTVYFRNNAIDGNNLRLFYERMDDSVEDFNVRVNRPGMIHLNAEVDIPREGAIFWNQWALYAYQMDTVVIYIDQPEGMSPTLGNSYLYLAVFCNAPSTRLDISARLSDSNGRYIELFNFKNQMIVARNRYQTIGYWDIIDFVKKSPHEGFTLDISYRTIQEYHTTSIDCSHVLQIAKTMSINKLKVRINGVSYPNGIYEENL